MSTIFSHIDVTTVSHVQGLLEAEGIRTEIRNDGVLGLSGAAPFAPTDPELRLIDEEDKPRAEAILRQYYEDSERAAKTPAWTCEKCGETVEGIFTECWNCRAPAPV